MYKIGLVGTGRWAEKIAKTIYTMGEGITAICQRTPKDISWLPKDKSVQDHVYDNVSDMLRKETLTHIITAIDPNGHYDIVEKATKYGLPVWLEKPMALSYTETEKIFALDGSIFVDYIHLYSECFQYLCKNVKDCTDIFSVGYGFGPNINHNFSMLYDYAVHELSMLLTMLDDIVIQNTDYISGASGEYYKINVKSDNDCNIVIEIGNDGSKPKSKTMTIDTKNGKWLYDGMQQRVFKDNVEVFAAKELPLKHAIRAFLSGERVNKDMTLKVMKLLDEMQERANRTI